MRGNGFDGPEVHLAVEPAIGLQLNRGEALDDGGMEVYGFSGRFDYPTLEGGTSAAPHELIKAKEAGSDGGLGLISPVVLPDDEEGPEQRGPESSLYFFLDPALRSSG